jgi:hypothetical protein
MSVSRWPALASASGLFLAALLGIFPGATRGDDAPDTDKWNVVFSDKFDREKVGERWKVVYGDWTIEDGALKGRLSKKDLAAYEYHEADIALKGTEIPATVEVRYETWSPDEVGSEAKFLTEASDAGIVMACLGVIHPAYRAKGTMAFVFKDTAYRCVGRAPRNTALTPKVRHKVRLVRKEDQATFFLDGEKVLSPNVSDAKGFRDLNLHLAGTWGKEGSVVYFDNLEVRIPPDQNK